MASDSHVIAVSCLIHGLGWLDNVLHTLVTCIVDHLMHRTWLDKPLHGVLHLLLLDRAALSIAHLIGEVSLILRLMLAWLILQGIAGCDQMLLHLRGLSLILIDGAL